MPEQGCCLVEAVGLYRSEVTMVLSVCSRGWGAKKLSYELQTSNLESSKSHETTPESSKLRGLELGLGTVAAAWT